MATYTDGWLAFCPKCGELFDWVDYRADGIWFGHYCALARARVWWNDRRTVIKGRETDTGQQTLWG